MFSIQSRADGCGNVFRAMENSSAHKVCAGVRDAACVLGMKVAAVSVSGPAIAADPQALRFNPHPATQDPTQQEYDVPNRNQNQGNHGDDGRSSKGRGFAGMDAAQQRQIASAGGRAAHASGHAHEFSSEEAREAGRKGGEARSQRSHGGSSDQDIQDRGAAGGGRRG